MLRVGLQNNGTQTVEDVSVWLDEMSEPNWHRLTLPRCIFGPQNVDPTGRVHTHIDLFARVDTSTHMTVHFVDGEQRVHYRNYTGILSVRAKHTPPRRYTFRFVQDPNDMFGLDTLELTPA